MKILIELAFDEAGCIRLLNWLAGENRRILLANPRLPGLYELGVLYHIEDRETWADYLNLMMKRFEDCDSLAAARAGEIQARGWRALNLQRGDHGAIAARRLGLHRIPAKVILRTETRPGQSGLYHCLVKYVVAGRIYYDDPSARLGMYGGRVDLRQPLIRRPDVIQRFAS